MNTFGAPIDDEEEEAIDVGGLNDIENKFLIPVGLWEMRTIDAKKEVSKSSGNPMVTLTVAVTGRVLEGNSLVEHEESQKHAGKEFKTYISFSPGALFKVVQVAKALDLPIDEKGRLRCKLSEFKNKQLVAKTSVREYDGRDSTNIGDLSRHPEGPDY